MKIQTKLIGAFSLLAIITLAVSIIGYLEANNLASALYEVGTVRLPSIQGLDMIQDAMTALRTSEQALLVPGIDDATIAEQLEQQKKAWDQVEKGWNLYEPLPQTEAESVKWKAFIPAWKAWKSDHEAVVALIAESRKKADPTLSAKAREQSAAIAAKSAKEAESLLADITAINDQVATEAKGRSVASRQDMIKVQNFLIISAIAGVLGAFSMGFFMGRTFTKPILEMAYALAKIAKGDFTISVPVRSNDEIGQMAETMNDMVEALRTSEARLRSLSDNLPNGMVYQLVREHDGKMRFLYVSAASERLNGVAAEAALQDSSALYRRIMEEDRPIVAAAEEASAKNLSVFNVVVRMRRTDGEIRWMQISSSPRRLDDGRILWDGIQTDITELIRAEESLRHSEERLRTVIEAGNDGIWEWDIATNAVAWSDRVYEMFKMTKESFGDTFDAVKKLAHPDDIPGFIQALEDHLKQNLPYDLEMRFQRGDGGYGYFLCRGKAIRDGSGKPLRMIGSICDVTDRKKAERDLRDSEERFRQVVENIQEVFWMTDTEKNRVLYVSPGYEKIWSRTCESLYRSPSTWQESVHPDDRERVANATATKQARGDYMEEYRIVRPDDSVRWVRDRAVPIRDIAGRVYRIAGVAEDITERRLIEEQFRQSQKMEAIGQLAGGVAHDFNNILGAIMMQAGLAGKREGLPPIVRELLSDIKASAERAANLTRQLLAFSRRQVMQPRQLDLNEIVTSLAKMLQRILGEDVHMQLNLYPSPLIAHADAGMLDQVLMNLAVNARDAMPSGGQMIIETAAKVITEEEALSIPDASPGRYVCLRVSDAGCGIAPENLARIFEPFFTTKEAGKGTGLGLATVFGIVKQHRGSILVSSEVGRGTTFQVFLPTGDAAGKSSVKGKAATESHDGTETILVVEDDPTVRKLTGVLLKEHGYNVLEACNGVEALQIWEQHKGRVQLLLTDMVMPEGVSGRNLAAQLQDRDPKLKVIFTSGYSAELAGRELKLQEGQNFLQKPCPPDQILEAVRRSLDS